MDKNETAGVVSVVMVLLALTYVFRSAEVVFGFIFTMLFVLYLKDEKISPQMKIVNGFLSSIFLLLIKLQS